MGRLEEALRKCHLNTCTSQLLDLRSHLSSCGNVYCNVFVPQIQIQAQMIQVKE